MCNTLNIKALELYCNIQKWNIELDTLIVNCFCSIHNILLLLSGKTQSFVQR